MKKLLKALWADESGQGTAEYVLLIAIVVGLVIMFKDKIKSALSNKISEIEGGIEQVGVQ